MRGVSQRSVNFLLAAALIIGAAFFFMWLIADLAGQERPYSSHGAHPGGVKAFYLLLEEMGLEIERWTAPLQRLPGEEAGRTLILVEPSRQGVGQREAEALQGWVEAGNRLLLLSVRQPVLLEAFGLEAEFPDHSNQVVLTPAESGHPVMEGVTRLEINRAAFFASPAGGEPLAEREGEIYVLYKRVGSGELIAVSDPDLITNRRIARADHVVLLLNAVETRGGGPVLYNERHHQFGLPQADMAAGQPGGVFTYLPFAGLQLALFTLLALFALGRRFGAPRPLPEQPLRAPADFIVPAAAMWRKARARRLAVETLFQGLVRGMGRKYRLGRSPDLKELAALGARITGREQRQFEKDFLKLAQASRSDRLTAAEMLALTRRIDRYRKELIK